MTSRKPFPLYLALLLGGFIVFLGWSARQASTDGARITDRDYYSKGLRYNTSQVERRAASVLGWQVLADLDDRTLSLQLNDRDGSSVEGADIVLTLMTPSRQIPLVPREQLAGTYLFQMPTDIYGEIPARYTIQREGARIERQLLINLTARQSH